MLGISSSSSGECVPSLILAAAELMVSHFSFNDYNDQHINSKFAALGFGGFGGDAVVHCDEQEVDEHETLSIWMECGRLSWDLSLNDVHKRQAAA